MVGRKLLVVRHGERVDFTFGDEWIKNCFDANDKYTKKNLNMPDAVPARKPITFLKDCPLTQIGSLQGNLVGKGLKEEELLQPGFQVYVSPALRCVETASAILAGMGLSGSVLLKVEPCLFEWTGWYADGNPSWMTPNELADSGFDIDTTYEPFIDYADIKGDETVDEYYQRSYLLAQHLLEKDENDLLLVAHGSTLDSCTRQLVGSPIRTFREMMGVLRGVPYCGVAIVERNEASKNWSIVSAASANISMRHSSAADFCAFKEFMGPGDGEKELLSTSPHHM